MGLLGHANLTVAEPNGLPQPKRKKEKLDQMGHIHLTKNFSILLFTYKINLIKI
jgi:hypothetical protein